LTDEVEGGDILEFGIDIEEKENAEERVEELIDRLKDK